jgi:hypothetical protein
MNFMNTNEFFKAGNAADGLLQGHILARVAMKIVINNRSKHFAQKNDVAVTRG